jgi:hypothetical protein
VTGACKLGGEGAATLQDRASLYAVLPRPGTARVDHILGRNHADRGGAGMGGRGRLGDALILGQMTGEHHQKVTFRRRLARIENVRWRGAVFRAADGITCSTCLERQERECGKATENSCPGGAILLPFPQERKFIRECA